MSGALSGLKVLELSQNLPGPYLTWLMAGLGAQVVKVENPKGGDFARQPLAPGLNGPAFFGMVNRNKKSIAINLKSPEGKEALMGLLETYDILVEGFRPGVMDRLGLGYEELRQRQPGLIFVSISGYGQKGSHRLRAGHDINYQALAGILGMTGGAEPAIPGVQIADLLGGSFMAMSGLLAAVIQRQAGGPGQYVDVAMFDGALTSTMISAAPVLHGEPPTGPGQGPLTGGFPCYHIYATKDGRHMSLGSLEDKFWQTFCGAINRPDLLDKAFAGPEVIEEVAGAMAQKDQAQWVEIFEEVDCCCEPVLDLDQALKSDLAKERGLLNLEPGQPPSLANPLKLSGSLPLPPEPAPELGAHTREVLRASGLSEEKIDQLIADGAVLAS